MHSPKRIKVTEVNPHLICVLCRGYYIDATTIIECLHSFCKTCIVKYLHTNKYCPICDVQVHKTSPLLNIRSDKTLQNIVYKLVPSLFKSEMDRRVEFYRQHPEHLPAFPEERGEIADNTPILLPDEVLIICLEYLCDKPPAEPVPKRFLHCPAEMSLGHLIKLIRGKFNLLSSHQVNILFKDDLLPEYLTIMEVAYTYQCRRKTPIHLYYRILELKRTTIRLLEVKERKEEPVTSKASDVECVLKEKQSEEKVVKGEKRPAMTPSENTVMEKGLVIEKTMQERSSQPGEKVENEWKEVQLQISENGVMSVRNMKNSECSPKPAVEAPQANSGASSPTVAQLSASMTPVTQTAPAPVVPTTSSLPNTRPTSSNGPLVSLPSELTTSIVPADYRGPPRIPSSKPILSVSKVTKDQVKKDFNNIEANKLSISRVPAAGFKEKGEALNKIVSKLSPNERVIGNTSVTIRPVLNTPPPMKTYQPPISQPPIQPQPLPKVQKAERKPQQTVRYKTLTSPTKQWNPSIDRMTMLTMKQNYDMTKPPRFFKQRNMPRYLGNPASGVKPMFGTSNEDASKDQKPRSPTKLPPPFTPGSPKAGKSPYPDKTTWTPRVPSPAHSSSLYNSNPYLLYSGFPGSFNPDPSMLANANPDLVRSMFANSAYHPSLPPSINMLFNPLHNVPRPTLESPPPMQRIQGRNLQKAKIRLINRSPTSSLRTCPRHMFLGRLLYLLLRWVCL
uniref:Polycomb complex protein BMI-1 n=1 Tax=Lygus hesperus TaxID=30085 RepID=A0A0A9W5V3_LYGHE